MLKSEFVEALEIEARLPELEWKLRHVSKSVLKQHLPAKLFKTPIEKGGESLILELKEDLHRLVIQKNERSANYLARGILQKVNVLVAACLAKKPTATYKNTGLSLNKIATSQQWINDLEQIIVKLKQQKAALLVKMENIKFETAPIQLLDVGAELGAVTRELTKAEEAYSQATAEEVI